MGWLDPAHKKMISKSPAYFQRAAPIFGASLEALMESHATLRQAGNLFRAVVIGGLILRVAEEDPANWSQDAIEYTMSSVKNAERLLPEPVKEAAWQVVDEFVRGGLFQDNQ